MSLAVLLSQAARPLAAQAPHAADVIVCGATPGGFCAAIAAAREGAKVILLEPTAHVGGVNTGGLSFSDSNQTVRSTVMGLFDEWHLRIEADYQSRGVQLPYQVSVKNNDKWTYEPHVAARVTKAMLDEAKVTVFTEQPLLSVEKEGPRIAWLVTSQARYRAKVFIDATYEGDLLASAKVSWTIGREGRKEYGESLAGKQYPKRTLPISGFNDRGQPLPFITDTIRGDDEAGDANVMTYSFRLCLTDDPANRVPLPQPANYDPAKFELLRRYARTSGAGIGLDLYPLPGGKFDGNNSIGGQFSLGLIGAATAWSEASPAERQTIWEAHQQYTLELLHFLMTDPSLPETIRKRYASLGLCRDEFPATGHWPPQLYVREGRRMKGEYVVTQKDVLEAPQQDDPIVVSSFPIDSHDCRRIALAAGGVVNEGTIFPVRMKGRPHGYLYHIPYRAILPRRGECSNLLVPVALSCTHVAFSSIRVEPTWMILGQSAGIAAALSAREECAVQELPYAKLRERLIAQGQVLQLPELPDLPQPSPAALSIDPKSLEGLVLDDEAAELTGEWSRSTNFKPHIGQGYRHDDNRGDGKSTAVFRFRAPKTGEYELRMAYSAHPTRSRQVPVRVKCGTHEQTLQVDQTVPLPPGQPFRPIGRCRLTSDAETTITLSNANTDGFVILDALQVLPAAE